jgi:uncharacterized protein YjiS (DUF1127 family)
MSCTQSLADAGPCRPLRPAVAAGDEARLRATAWQHAVRALLRWIARSSQRHDLARLDDHLLKDIGVTRAEAAREAAKPFWRE